VLVPGETEGYGEYYVLLQETENLQEKLATS
jgi:hypothetical protein